MVRKLSYLLLASATAVSFSAIAGGNQKQSQGQSDQPDVVKQAQEKLSAAGMDAGQADGKLGPKTQAAVKDFQQSKGIQASGQLDRQTLAALGVSGSSGSSTSSPSASASSPSASSGASSSSPSGPTAGDSSSGSTGSSGKSSKY